MDFSLVTKVNGIDELARFVKALQTSDAFGKLAELEEKYSQLMKDVADLEEAKKLGVSSVRELEVEVGRLQALKREVEVKQVAAASPD